MVEKSSLLELIISFFVVVAADGFTYERKAIEVWLQSNDHSPMTNEKLAHKNLNTNIVAKHILSCILQNKS